MREKGDSAWREQQELGGKEEQENGFGRKHMANKDERCSGTFSRWIKAKTGELESSPDALLTVGQADSHTVERRPSAINSECTGAACPMTLKSYSESLDSRPLERCAAAAVSC